MITLDDLQGHWHRAWLRAPDHEDTTTRVHWMQCGAVYADIRIPADRPDLTGARALSDLDPPALLSLLQAEGFAGTITVADGICTWDRVINWHGTPDAVDAGRMSFSAQGELIEDGVHADYAELWRRAPDRPDRALHGTVAGQDAVIVASPAAFVVGLGVPGGPSPTAERAALSQGTIPADLPHRFQSVYAYGRWDGQTGIATLATNPFIEGRPVVEQSGDGLSLILPCFDGTERVWPFLPRA